MTGNGGYDTAMLAQVDILRLVPDGVLGHHGGAWIVDRHHRDHPAAKRWHAEDTLSFGFTSHYDHMSTLFSQTQLGIAGENVIVATDEMIKLEAISGGVRLETKDGTIEMSRPEVLEPCVEFTRFMTSRPTASAREVKPDREKLRNGVRGYVVGIPGPDPVHIGIGDTISISPRLSLVSAQPAEVSHPA
jgi:hypothetical protein